MGKPVLSRMEPDDFVQRYGIPGFPHLVVEGCYSGSDSDRVASLYGWSVHDGRYTPGLDRWRRNTVIFRYTLAEIREWVREGGPSLWDPERRKADTSWEPVPDALVQVVSESDDFAGPAITRVSDQYVRSEAKFRAGLIIEATVNAGWATDHAVVGRYGTEAAERIGEELSAMANKLIRQSGRKS
jgi:hypothetical protein